MKTYSKKVADLRRFATSLVDVRPRSVVLDVGCGRGEDLCLLGCGLESGDARLVGLDMSQVCIDACRITHADDSRFEFVQHDVDLPLPFAPETFDCVYSRDLLECVTDKPAFLKEVARVLKPKGNVVFVHWDFDTTVIDSTDKPLVRRIVQEYSDLKQNWMRNCDGWMGRRQWANFQESGRFDGEVIPFVLQSQEYLAGAPGYEMIHRSLITLMHRGIIPEQDFKRFLTDVEERAARDCFFYSVTSYIFKGRKVHRRPSNDQHDQQVNPDPLL